MKLHIDSKVVILVLTVGCPAYLAAGAGPDPDQDSAGSNRTKLSQKAAKHPEIERLELAIEMSKIKKQAIKSRNEELSSRLKELEARILEMRKELALDEETEEGNIREN